jgi:glycosyltransferase involved in cell wall biosynthesis
MEKKIFISQGWEKRGAEICLKNYINSFKGYSEIEIINFGKNKFNIEGIKEQMLYAKKIKRIYKFFQLVKFFISLNSEQKIVVYFVNGKIIDFSITIFLVKIFKRRLDIRLWEHCIPEKHWINHGYYSKLVIKFFYKIILIKSNKIFVPSQIIADKMEHYKNKIFIIGNILKVDLSKKDNYEKDVLKDKIKFVYVGAFSKEKRPDLFLRLISLLNKVDNRVMGVMYGQGMMENELKRFIFSNELDDCIKVLPWTDNIHHVLNRADCLIVTSEFETYCNVIAEALFLGCPVASTKWAGIENIYKDFINYIDTDFDDLHLQDLLDLAKSRKSCLVEGEFYYINQENYTSNEF